MDKISVIIPTYNRKEMLNRLLESFGKLRCSVPFEVIVIDDCSDDGTESVMAGWKKTVMSAEIRYQRLPTRSGPARARNVGISLATGNILAFTDSDCVADPSWLDLLYTRLISSPDLAGIGGRVLATGDDIFSRYNTVYRVLDPPAHINAIITANCMFRKQPVVDVGMFDEYFLIPCGEEIALCMKLWLAGNRLGYEEKAVVCHDYRQNLEKFSATFYQYGQSERVLYEHNLAGYLRYMHYPEQSQNNLGLRHRLVFPFVFFLRMVSGIAVQYRFLRDVARSPRELLLLNGLYAIHQVSYHIGRGTFLGRLGRALEKNNLKIGGAARVP